uniref:Putative secreted peptide n=1 Tax=Anopheles braziliensis TaxID=58242 RepID=A0A2M3ZW13_9DIPT
MKGNRTVVNIQLAYVFHLIVSFMLKSKTHTDRYTHIYIRFMMCVPLQIFIWAYIDISLLFFFSDSHLPIDQYLLFYCFRVNTVAGSV